MKQMVAVVGLVAVLFVGFAGCCKADTCQGPGSQETYLNLCKPACNSTNWCDDVNNNFTTIGANFAGTTALGGHAHDGTSGEGPKLLAASLSATDSPADNECPTYDSATGKVEWTACPAISGSPTTFALPYFLNSTQLGSTSIISNTTGGLTFPIGGTIDFTATGVSGGTGVILPQAVNCADATEDGQVCWDTNDDFLVIGTVGGQKRHAQAPASSTDNAVVRWDGTGGIATQNSTVTIADDGATTIDVPATATSGTLEALHSDMDYTASGASTASVYGGRLRSNINGSNPPSAAVGASNEAWFNVGATGTLALLSGSQNFALNTSAGTVTDSYGTLGLARQSNASGTTTNAYGGFFSVQNTVAGGIITNSFGVFIAEAVDTGTITNDWGFYQEGTGAKNSIGGALVVGANAAPAATAALEVSSTTKGLLLPRMTGAQRDAISSPADGLLIYNTTTSKGQIRAGGAWVDLH